MKVLGGVVIGVFLLIVGYIFTQSRGTSDMLVPAPYPTTVTLTGSPIPEANYRIFSTTAFNEVTDKKRVLFFYAAWCPTCRPANESFTKNVTQIPSDVILFRVDYDTEDELKKQYGVTYQHTFVMVDEAGNAVKKWNGGSIDELVKNTQ